jgi:alpha-tubulin suppressor-like RCC1 family protein
MMIEQPVTSARLASIAIAAFALAACDNNDSPRSEVRVQPTPVQVTLPAAATQPGAGWAFTGTVVAGGALYTWGSNYYWQLGNGGAGVSCVDGFATCSNGPVAVTPPATWTRFSGGFLHGCGLDAAGAAWCWGSGYAGQLGNGLSTSSSVPVAVSGALTFSQIHVSLGGDLTCGVAGGNALFCWGTGYNGQGGTGGSINTASVPYRVSPAQTFNAVAVGELHTCALDNANAAFCWGDNRFGQVGDGTMTQRNLPTAALGGRTYVQIVSGLAHSCALDAGGVAYCWGSSGQIGRTAATLADQATPVAVAGAQRFTRIAAGGWHSCGLDAAGATWCWGDNTYSQFGDSAGSSQTPRQITALPAFAQIVAGGAHTCGVTAAGVMSCWGANSYGQTGRLP